MIKPHEKAGIYLQELGFSKIQEQLTLRKRLNKDDPPTPSKAILEDSLDISAERVLAHARNFVFDRFHQDPAIPDEQADSFMASWIGNSLNGRKKLCVIKDNFCSYIHVTNTISIDLVSVLDKGKGYGQSILTMLAERGVELGCTYIEVTTEEQNEVARYLYKKAGFTLHSIKSVYHFHQG